MYNCLTSFLEVANYALYIMLAILILLLMITVHELGHFIAGKILGFKINEFSIGFGPKLFQKIKKDGEKFSIRLFPLGGYCAFSGEDKESVENGDFNSFSPWKRIIVLVSGVLMNYIFALVLIGLMFGIYGQTTLMSYKTNNLAGVSIENKLIDKDVILSANGKNIYMLNDLMLSISDKEKGDEVDFIVRRNGENKEIKLILQGDTHFKNVEDVERLYNALNVYYELDEETGDMTESGFYTTYIRLGFFETIGRVFEYSFKLATSIFVVIGELITGGLGLSSMGGTITTISVTANVIKVGGFRYFLNIASFIGINLAVFNILPIPALDGSRVVFTAIEGIRKKPINRKVEGIIHTIGFIFILLFAIIVDLQQCF